MVVLNSGSASTTTQFSVVHAVSTQKSISRLALPSCSAGIFLKKWAVLNSRSISTQYMSRQEISTTSLPKAVQCSSMKGDDVDMVLKELLPSTPNHMLSAIEVNRGINANSFVWRYIPKHEFFIR